MQLFGKMRYLPIVAVVSLCFGFPEPARGDMVTFDVSVDTSSITGTAGSLEFQFNPGISFDMGTDVLSAQIGSFTGDGTLGANIYTFGDASNTSLASGVSFQDDMSFNDFIQDFTYGTTFMFQVTFSGNLANPDPSAAFSMTLWDQSGAVVLAGGSTLPLLTSDPSGAALIIDINSDGTQTIPVEPEGQQPTAAPEPSSLVLFGVGMVAMGGSWMRRRRNGTLIYRKSPSPR